MLQKLFAAFLMTLAATSALAQSTAFTYQGELRSGGQVVNGLFDMQFKLFDAPSGGAQLGSTVCLNNITAVDGRVVAQLDFGQQYAVPAPRYIEAQVRADTGLDCMNTTGFTVLAPRQLLTATPLATHAKAAYSLDAPDGSPASAVFVDNAGQVGIGTTTPGTNLTIAGNMELGTTSSDYRTFRVGGGNSSGYLFGSYPLFGDGIHLAYNYFADAAGGNHVVNVGGQTSRISLGYGSLELATGSTDAVPVGRLRVDQNGNIGVGTSSPASKLDVRGDIRLGTTGQYLAASGEENLRIIRGTINGNGTIIAGSGFHVTRDGAGVYEVTFNTAFAGTPSVTATCDTIGLSVTAVPIVTLFQTNSAGVSLFISERSSGDYIDSRTCFIAIGPR